MGVNSCSVLFFSYLVFSSLNKKEIVIAAVTALSARQVWQTSRNEVEICEVKSTK